jgi:hypothetical protein
MVSIECVVFTCLICIAFSMGLTIVAAFINLDYYVPDRNHFI